MLPDFPILRKIAGVWQLVFQTHQYYSAKDWLAPMVIPNMNNILKSYKRWNVPILESGDVGINN